MRAAAAVQTSTTTEALVSGFGSTGPRSAAAPVAPSE